MKRQQKPIKCRCGCEAKVLRAISGGYFVECGDQPCSYGEIGRTANEAVKLWNKMIRKVIHD